MELRGLEPLTLCMPCRCATSCATAPERCPPVRQATRGILANGPVGCEIGSVPGADGLLVVRREPEAAADGVLGQHAVAAVLGSLERAARAPTASRGAPSAPTFRQAPWSTTMPVSPGSSAARQSCERRHDAVAHLLGRLLPRHPQRRRPRRRHAAYSSGKPRGELRAGSGPERSPTSYSRSRGVGLDGQPAGRRRRTPRSAGPAPGRWTTAARARTRRARGATAAAWACPMASSGTSAWPWARPCAFQSVSPCRSRTRVRASGTVRRRR